MGANNPARLRLLRPANVLAQLRTITSPLISSTWPLIPVRQALLCLSCQATAPQRIRSSPPPTFPEMMFLFFCCVLNCKVCKPEIYDYNGSCLCACGVSLAGLTQSLGSGARWLGCCSSSSSSSSRPLIPVVADSVYMSLCRSARSAASELSTASASTGGEEV